MVGRLRAMGRCAQFRLLEIYVRTIETFKVSSKSPFFFFFFFLLLDDPCDDPSESDDDDEDDELLADPCDSSLTSTT